MVTHHEAIQLVELTKEAERILAIACRQRQATCQALLDQWQDTPAFLRRDELELGWQLRDQVQWWRVQADLHERGNFALCSHVDLFDGAYVTAA